MNDVVTIRTDPQQDIAAVVADLGQRAKAAARDLALAPAEQCNLVLTHAANALRTRTPEILSANANDVEGVRESGKDEAFIDRLTITKDRVADMADALDAISKQDDPLGRSLATFERPNGLKIDRVSVPIGVIAMIYES